MTSQSESESEPSSTELARRAGERRQADLAAEAAEERRQTDRRQRKPGIGGLVRALLGKR